MKKTYSLTAAQNMHYQWIKEYKTQQVSGLSIVAAFQADIDIPLLKRSIELEKERYACLRLRFTKPDENGEIKQYIADCEPEDMPEMDMTGMTMTEADDVMQHLAYETFDGDDIPMCEFRIVKLPENYTGFFVHMDHRLNDSVGVAVMATDIMNLYKHLKYGEEYPAPLADFEKVLISDLQKASNEKRLAKAKRFWDEQLDTYGEPLYSDIQGPSVLEKARQKHNDPNLRAADIERKELFVAVKDYQLEVDSMQRAINFCLNNQISPTNLLLLVIRTYLSKMNDGQEDITIENHLLPVQNGHPRRHTLYRRRQNDPEPPEPSLHVQRLRSRADQGGNEEALQHARRHHLRQRLSDLSAAHEHQGHEPARDKNADLR